MDELEVRYIGYCWFHRKEMTAEDVKYKNCKCKPNTKSKCSHFQQYKVKEHYRNDNFKQKMSRR